MADNPTHELPQLEARIQDILESQLAQTLGQVKALQRVTEEITSTEREIRRHQAIAAQIDAEIKTSKSKALKSELDREKDRIARLTRIRSALVVDLSELTDALGNS